jgi:hypothetical protein
VSPPRLGLRSRESLGLPERPRWLSQGLVRLGLLCVLIVLIAMLRPRLDRESAAIVCAVAAVVAVAGAAAFLGVTRRVARRFAFLHPGHQVADAVAMLLRRTGLPLLGLVFFLAWTVVYLALWAIHPDAAFTGLEPHPRFADLFYYSVSTAFISPPGDIIAHSRGVRAATLIEMLTGFGLLSAYLSTFVDFRGPGGGRAVGGPPTGEGGPPQAEGSSSPTPGT